MKPPTNRRTFLTQLGQSVAVASVGGLFWGYLLQQQAKAMPFALRPPGALTEDDFAARCIKCGQCVQACPYGTLDLASAEQGIPIGTPYFNPRQTPCYMCPDIPCKTACPTGALQPELTDINASRMGLAVIDIENCLSWIGLRCEICYRDCPVQDQAIRIEHLPRKLSKHAKFVPVVNADHCTGCGVCEKACPTEKAAIRILPHDLVQGKLGEHYRLDWTVDSPITQEYKPHHKQKLTKEPRQDEAPGMDYLNEGGL